MKFLYVTLALAGLLSSCKVYPPIDPLTFKPSCKYCPNGYYSQFPTSCKSCKGHVHIDHSK